MVRPFWHHSSSFSLSVNAFGAEYVYLCVFLNLLPTNAFWREKKLFCGEIDCFLGF